MSASTTQKHMMAVTVSVITLFFCSLAMGQDSGQNTPNEKPKNTTGTPAQEVKATPDGESNLTFMDDQQTWRDSEVNSYKEWMKRNPRYSHPMFQSQWDVEHGSTFVDDTPDPNYRGWTYRRPWFNRGAVTNVRGRILWVNDRYPSYISNKSDQAKSTGTDTEKPKTESAAPTQGK